MSLTTILGNSSKPAPLQQIQMGFKKFLKFLKGEDDGRLDDLLMRMPCTALCRQEGGVTDF